MVLMNGSGQGRKRKHCGFFTVEKGGPHAGFAKVRRKAGGDMATLAPRIEASSSSSATKPQSLAALMVGAVGVVYGDIGTSPLYAMKETFVGAHPLVVDKLHIFGVLSLIFWSLMVIVTFKYVFVAMRADNRGEGGSFALLALISRNLGEKRWTHGLVTLGVLATALFYGDAIITPAISVLSAVEGLTVVQPNLDSLVIPIALVILIALFLVQSRGTAKVGALFGPVVLIYFAALAGLGVSNILAHPEVVGIVSPHWAVEFFLNDSKLAFLAMGSVFLAVTGAETLYADMGHFGRKAIGLSWVTLVYPCLLLNYMGQGALLLSNSAAAKNPFFLMAPHILRLPLVLLATGATIIASQAVISGAFSVTHQAVQLGFLPRLKIRHTSANAAGQIYMPAVNWTLLIMVVLLVLAFGESTRLAAAYGIAVSGTMLITTAMLAVFIFQVWRWNKVLAAVTIGLFLAVDSVFFASNITKIADGGWFPLTVAAITFVTLTTWGTGSRLMRQQLAESSLPLSVFIKSMAGVHRVAGTAVFLSGSENSVPSALLHNLKHNRVIHERVVIMTIKVDDVPHIRPNKRCRVNPVGDGFYGLVIHYGFMDEVDVPADLLCIRKCGQGFDLATTSFFLGRHKLIATRERPGMLLWREKLFALMRKNSESAVGFFKLPANRVIELGSLLLI